MTERDGLEFVVRFLNTGLTPIRPGEMLDLQEDIGHFLGMITGDEMPRVGRLWISPAAPKENWPPKDLVDMQRELRRLASASSPKAWEDIPTEGEVKRIVGRVTRLRVEYGQSFKALRLQPTLPMMDPDTGSILGPRFLAQPRDAFMFQALLLLTQPVIQRSRLRPSAVHLCGRPGCERFFIRTKAKKWCSDRCKNIMGQRKRRASLPPEERRAKYRDEYYDKQERKTGWRGPASRRKV